MGALTNTNFFDRHIGDAQILCIEPKPIGDLPRNLDGISLEIIDNFQAIDAKERTEILYKRGLYHESIHIAMGTTDERKCDVFALLKVMREHPSHAKAIFDIYNAQRAHIGHTVSTLQQNRTPEQYARAIKGGIMTYIMPNTYEKLKSYALAPETIPNDDAGLLDLTCRLTANTEFTPNQLNDFQELVSKENISINDFAQNEIVKMCMLQGGFKDVETYIRSDKKLTKLFENQLTATTDRIITDASCEPQTISNDMLKLRLIHNLRGR